MTDTMLLAALRSRVRQMEVEARSDCDKSGGLKEPKREGPRPDLNRGPLPDRSLKHPKKA